MSRLTLTPIPNDAAAEEERGERVLVLVDGSSETERALRVAIRFSLDRRALLTIAAYAPGPLREENEEMRRGERLLVAAQAEAEVDGVPAERCLLHGPNPLDQLRALVAPAPSRDLVVLCNPGAVTGSLRPLARSIVRTPPCSLYVLPPLRAGISRWRLKLIGWLAARGASHESRL